jgi:hypothetical protein
MRTKIGLPIFPSTWVDRMRLKQGGMKKAVVE